MNKLFCDDGSANGICLDETDAEYYNDDVEDVGRTIEDALSDGTITLPRWDAQVPEYEYQIGDLAVDLGIRPAEALAWFDGQDDVGVDSGGNLRWI